ncbi:efflux RND transporter periplasmic adaptor subunit [Thalassovita aquimarina]|uniref:efflux RND transporter periplasmic adaptor subunit n=1 Tax=Thalassovita aquimarina TaxID=2785917 RepID=UPI00356A8D0B
MSTDADDISKTLALGVSRRRPWRWIGLAVLAATLAGGAYYYRATAPDGQVRYITEPVSRGGVEVVVSATGSIEPTNLYEISSELSGTIAAVHVDYNDWVEDGTVLATLDTSKLEAQLAVQKASLASAEAKVTLAQASLDEARKTLERGQELSRRGVETEQVLIGQQAAFARAGAELQSAIANRDLAAANLELVQADLAKACICSPVDGVVLNRAAEEGQIVAASLSAPVLFTVAEDLTQMELQIDIDEADIGRVKVGQQARFTVDAYDDRVFPAEIAKLRFAHETVEGVVTYKGILTLDNSDMALLPGMTATAEIVTASVEDALLVPNAALRFSPPVAVEDDGDKGGSGLLGLVFSRRPDSARRVDGDSAPVVWVLRDGGPAELRVETGPSDGTVTVIQPGSGLQEGDLVITDRFVAD